MAVPYYFSFDGAPKWLPKTSFSTTGSPAAAATAASPITATHATAAAITATVKSSIRDERR